MFIDFVRLWRKMFPKRVFLPTPQIISRFFVKPEGLHVFLCDGRVCPGRESECGVDDLRAEGLDLVASHFDHANALVVVAHLRGQLGDFDEFLCVFAENLRVLLHFLLISVLRSFYKHQERNRSLEIGIT